MPSSRDVLVVPSLTWMLSTKKRKRKASSSAAEGDADEEEALVAAPAAVSKHRAGVANDAALLFKLQELTGGVDADTSDEAWIETLVVTPPEPLAIDDVEDDLKRELALCGRLLLSPARVADRYADAWRCCVAQLQAGAGRGSICARTHGSPWRAVPSA